jgi:hypothetical protein
MTSLNNWVHSFSEGIVNTKKDIHEELNLRIQGMWIQIETTLHGLETLHKLHITQSELKTQLAEVKALAKHRSCRMGTAVFQQQFETMAEHNYQQPREEGTNLITTLNVPAAHILQWHPYRSDVQREYGA